MMRPASSLLFVLLSFILSVKTSHGLYCLVGKGNSSEVLPTDIPTDDDEIKAMMKEKGGGLHFGSFVSRECKKDKDSILKNVEELTKNVKKKIEEGVSGLEKIGNSLSETLKLDQRRRKKREDKKDEDDDFACSKIVMGGNAWRSCVPKVKGLELKCTAGTGLGICYCHDNNCNAASGLSSSSFLLLFAAATVFVSIKRFI